MGEILMAYNLTGVKPPHLPWFPDQVGRKSDDDLSSNGILGLFERLKTSPYRYQLLYWNMIQNCMPPYFSKQFYTLAFMPYSNHSECRRFAELKSGLALWLEILGIPLFDVMHTLQSSNESPAARSRPRVLEGAAMPIDSNDKNDLKGMVDIEKFLKMTFKNVGIEPPTPTDLCKSAAEFLLEPGVLIQLPWQPVIFHQWLVAALAEVLLLERASAELRHWAIPREYAKTAGGLLALVRTLKERIWVGFAVLGEQIKSYPSHTYYPEIIMDFVVLPSVPLLQFLCTGKANTLVKRLKTACSDHTGSYEDLTCVSPETYLVCKEVERLSLNHCYNFHNWLGKDPRKPFPTFQSGVREVVTELRARQKQDSVLCPSTIHARSMAEQRLLELTKSKCEQMSPEDKLETALFVMQNKVLKAGWLPGLTAAQLREKIRCAHLDSALWGAGDVASVAVQQALMWRMAHQLLANSERENSALMQVVVLQLQVLEREQLVRLTQTCGLLFQIAPKGTATSASVIDIKALNDIIRMQRKEMTEQTRGAFWLRFTYDWRKPVSANEAMPPPPEKKASDMPQWMMEGMEDCVCDLLLGAHTGTVVLSYQARVGRLLVNAARDSFEACAKGGEPFPDMTYVQYLLVACISGVMEQAHIIKFGMSHCSIINHLRSLVHALIQRYEKRFIDWKAGKCMQESSPDTPLMDIMPPDVKIYLSSTNHFFVNVKMVENCRVLIGYYATRINYIACTCAFDHIFNVIMTWPTCCMNRDFELRCIEFQVLTNNCYTFIFKFMEMCWRMAIEVYHVPKPGTLIPHCPELGDLYLTSTVLSELDIAAELALRGNPSVGRHIDDELHNAKEAIKQDRYEIQEAVASAKDMTALELKEFIASKKPKLLAMFKLIKKGRAHAANHFEVLCKERLPYSALYPDVFRPAVEYLIEGNFDKLIAEYLPLFSERKPPEPAPRKKCRNCGRRETNRKNFQACEECIKQKYPDVHYFCSKECKERYWKVEHQAEHLEFELGLGKYATKS